MAGACPAIFLSNLACRQTGFKYLHMWQYGRRYRERDRFTLCKGHEQQRYRGADTGVYNI